MYLLRPRRDSYGQAFSLYTFDNVNYVSWCTVRGASVFTLEYRSVDSACQRRAISVFALMYSNMMTEAPCTIHHDT